MRVAELLERGDGGAASGASERGKLVDRPQAAAAVAVGRGGSAGGREPPTTWWPAAGSVPLDSGLDTVPSSRTTLSNRSLARPYSVLDELDTSSYNRRTAWTVRAVRPYGR